MVQREALFFGLAGPIRRMQEMAKAGVEIAFVLERMVILEQGRKGAERFFRGLLARADVALLAEGERFLALAQELEVGTGQQRPDGTAARVSFAGIVEVAESESPEVAGVQTHADADAPAIESAELFSQPGTGAFPTAVVPPGILPTTPLR